MVQTQGMRKPPPSYEENSPEGFQPLIEAGLCVATG